MKEQVFLGNVGQRDLGLDEQGLTTAAPRLAEKLGKLRADRRLGAWAQTLLSEWDTVGPYLCAPMLEPVLSLLLARGAAPLSRAVLFGTRQQSKEFAKGDTGASAEVLAKWLEGRFPELFLRPVEVCLVREPPHDLNAMLFTEYPRHFSGINGDAAHVVCTGGTPACNMALMLVAVERFGAPRTAIYHMAEGNALPTVVRMGDYLEARRRRAALERLLARRDFDAVATDDRFGGQARSLAAAAAARMNFDFRGCHETLAGATFPPELHSVRELQEEARRLCAGKGDAALRDLYWNAVTKWRRNECADFLGRVWRLQESTLRAVIARHAGLAMDEAMFRDGFKEWCALPENAATADAIRKKLDSSGRKGGGQPLLDHLPVMTALLDHWGECWRRDAEKSVAGFDNLKDYQGFMDVLGRLRRLTELRNRSVIAHGFEGLSKSDLIGKAKLGSPDEMEAFLRVLAVNRGVEPGADPYEAFANAVLAVETAGENACLNG